MMFFTFKNNKKVLGERSLKLTTHFENVGRVVPVAFIQLFLLLFFTVIFQSCDGEEEPIPSFIRIDSMSLTTSGIEGSASHKITAAQITVGTQTLGIFPLPVTVPALEFGTHDIAVDAIVVESGISAIRELYPFYSRYTVTGDLVAGEVLQVNPEVTYNSAANFVLVEDFDGGNAFVDDLDGDPATRIEVSFDDVFEGSASGKITLNEAGSSASVGTGLFYDLPTSGERVYLEINYKCNNNFAVGFRAVQLASGATADRDVVIFTPSAEWNKVYVSLNQQLTAINGDRFQIYFRMDKSNDVNIAELVLDNIKLIHQ